MNFSSFTLSLLNANNMAAFTSSRTFGMEIEMANANPEQAADAISGAGIPCMSVSYGHKVTKAGLWVATTDGSLQCRHCYSSSHTAEVVSPILQGRHGLLEIHQVMTALSNAGAVPNETCGLHVHIGAAEFHNDWNKLCRLQDRYIGLGMHKRAERGSENMYKVYESDADRAEYMRNFAEEAEVSSQFYRHNYRYTAVNYCSLYRKNPEHRTIEFRQHAGTLDADEVSRWLVECTNLVDEVAEWRGCNVCGNQHPQVSGVEFCQQCRTFYCEGSNHKGHCNICDEDYCGAGHVYECTYCSQTTCVRDNSSHGNYCYNCKTYYCGGECNNSKHCEMCDQNICGTHFTALCGECNQLLCSNSTHNHGQWCTKCSTKYCADRCPNCCCVNCKSSYHHDAWSCLLCHEVTCDYVGGQNRHNVHCDDCHQNYCDPTTSHTYCPGVVETNCAECSIPPSGIDWEEDTSF